MVCKFLDKISSGGVAKSEIMPNQELVEEFYKPIIRNFEERKVNLCFKDNVWSAGLVDTQFIYLSIFNKWFRFLLCAFDIYSKYT